jgi:hypothetical protein
LSADSRQKGEQNYTVSGKQVRETLQQGGMFSVLSVNVIIKGSIDVDVDPRAMFLSLFSTCVILPASSIY